MVNLFRKGTFMLDFRMETFLAVCRYMNFTHAATSLGLTQPAVSQHIKYLEKKYSSQLFIRESKRLLLTSAGEILLSALKTMKSDENLLKERMQKSISLKKSLTFGVTMTIGEYAIVPELSLYIKKHPDTDFHIHYGNTETLLSSIRDGSVDFAIIEGDVTGDNYETIVYRSEEYIAAASAYHKFSHPVKTLKDLTDERLLIREPGSGTRSIFEKILSLKNLSVKDFRQIAEIESIHTIVSLLSHDCGISFLYKAAVKDEISSGQIIQIPLSDFMMTHDFTFVWNKNSIFSDEYKAVLNELLQLRS